MCQISIAPLVRQSRLVQDQGRPHYWYLCSHQIHMDGGLSWLLIFRQAITYTFGVVVAFSDIIW
ncbi:hypothetical protein Z945_1435 [Sulfitobacter noctilucae]|nr:hypothetical protein Z945_1435 [Sulfitobacter noctilucae]